MKNNRTSNFRKTIVFTTFAVSSMLSLTACGAKGAINATYGTIYDSETSAEVMAALPADTMVPIDIADSLTDGSMRYELTLDLESTGDYTLVYDYYTPNESDEEAADFLRYEVSFVGTYEKEDSTVTLSAAEIGQVTYTAGSSFTSDDAYSALSFDGSGQTGVWYSDDDATILNLFPGGTAEVSDSQVTSITIN